MQVGKEHASRLHSSTFRMCWAQLAAGRLTLPPPECTTDLPVGGWVGGVLAVIHHTLYSSCEELEGRAEAPLLKVCHHKASTNGHHTPAATARDRV